MTSLALAHPGVANSVAFPGLSINGFVNAPNTGIAFVTLKPSEERARMDGMDANSIVADLNQRFAAIQDAYVAIFPPPPVQGLGTVGGFKLYVEDRAGLGFEELYRQVQGAAAAGQQVPSLAGLFSSFQVSVPQIDVNVDRERVKTYGIPLTDVFDTLQVYLGSLYANDFNRFGRTYQVNVQAESSFRAQPEQIARLKTRNARGEMVPLGSVLRVSRTYGPDQVMHYNGYPAAELNGGPAPGHSSGQAQGAIAELLGRTLPNGMTFEWTELAYQDAISGNTMFLIFPLCVLLVYGVLAAQYESWSLPLTVILIVPMTLLSAIAGVWLTGGDNNVFTQISFLVLAGLACKNAILIVEFARQREAEGEPRRTAILDACRIRLRPVLMTSVAFIMGVVPLVLASGPGAEVRQAMGIAVFSGMVGVTLFGVFLTPVFYLVIENLADRLASRPRTRRGRRRCRPRLRVTNRAHITNSPFRSQRAMRKLLIALVAAQLAGCAVRTAPPPSTLERTPLTRWDASVFSAQAYDAALVAAARRSGPRAIEHAAIDANRDVRSALARFDQARAVFDEDRRRQYPTVTAGAFVDVRDQAQPGFRDAAVADHHLPRRRSTPRGSSISSAASARRSPRRGQCRELRSRAAQRARQRRRRRRAELLRAARHPAAAVGARSQSREPARDAAADRGAARRGHSAGNRTSPARRRGSRRSRRTCRRCAPRSPSANIGSRCSRARHRGN